MKAASLRKTSQISHRRTSPNGIEQHREYLFHNALGRLRSREMAEDAVQDSLLAALAGAKKFSGQSSQRTWLTGILKHKVCDQVRRVCRERVIFDPNVSLDREQIGGRVSGADVLLARSSNPRVDLERKELGEAINRALAKLPRRLATAFSLYETEDWSGRDICKALQISENNLWITLHRARKQLRTELALWHAQAA